MPGNHAIEGLTDSKELTPAEREALDQKIRERAEWGIGSADVTEIDELNILWASMLAMQRAVAALHEQPGHVLVDGNRCPSLPCPSTAIVKYFVDGSVNLNSKRRPPGDAWGVSSVGRQD